MDWRECEKKNLTKKVSPDLAFARSLVKSADKKFETQTRIAIDDISAASKVSLLYDSLRELAEAISLIKGYRIYNHECYCAFFSEILGEPDLAEQFDAFRKIRNGINYYARDLTAEEAQSLVPKLVGFIDKLKKEYLSGVKRK
ncbi:MAG: hypothetical protein V1820_00150 [archaeon]